MNTISSPAPAPLRLSLSTSLPPLALVGATVAGIGALAFLVAAFVVDATILRVACGSLGLLLAGGCWLVRSYYRASQACELPVSPYHRRDPNQPPD